MKRDGIGSDRPGSPRLHAAFPNPFAGSTTVRFYLPETQRVAVGVYDVMGRLTKSLLDAPRASGIHEVGWDGTDSRGHPATAGVYFLRIETAGASLVEKTILVR